MTGDTLSLEGIRAGYGDFQALFDVGLHVDPGEAVGVVGPNGAGKTTLLRVISGMLRPKAGTARFGDADLATLPAHALPALGIAHVPENRRLFPHLTVEENLRVGAYIPSARKRYAERADYVFGMFPRLKERRRQLAGTMSGEQQMCAIGRALMSSPRILLLDEPSAGLAPLVVAQVFALVERIRAEGLTVLIVEQNVAQVLRVVDRAYVLEAGHVVAAGSSAELASDPKIRSAFLGGH
jgi:branched-chain amino acid transport system ATP-binding protein